MTSSRQLALITGASSGIGAIYADRLARRGYDLVLVARRRERLAALAETLTATYGVAVEAVDADLTTDAGIAKVEKILAGRDTLSLLVNNAGNARLSATADMAPDDMAGTIALNVTALTRLTRAALPGFLARNRGTIINVGSVLAFHSLPVTSVYSGTKGYVLNFTRGLQEELAGTGVKVQLVLPAGTATDFYDAAGMPLSAFDPAVFMTAEQLVDAALAGLDKGEAITMPSVQDVELWEAYEGARSRLFAGTQNGRPAERYL